MTITKKLTIAVVTLSLALACIVGETLAFLIDVTASVTNTFTYGDVNIELTEESGKNSNYMFKMIPGNEITKDPKVTVEKDSEACWLFVTIEKSAKYDAYLEGYEIADGWKELSSEESTTYKVYYREVDAATAEAGTSYQVLKGNKVTVRTHVTKNDMEAIKEQRVAKPTLTFTAYAVQHANVEDAATAWGIATAS